MMILDDLAVIYSQSDALVILLAYGDGSSGLARIYRVVGRRPNEFSKD